MKEIMNRFARGALACVLGVVALAHAQVEARPVVPPGDLLLGTTLPLIGPTARLGQDMKSGIEAALGEVNAAGGIGGRKIHLVALDDGYEPDRAAANARALIEKHGVLAMVGCVGTPTAVATIPIAVESKTLFYGAFTGAGVLRKDPPERYVVNFRASYAQETGEMVDALVAHAGLKPEEVGFFTQRDAYGDAGYSGGMAALRRHGLKNDAAVAHGRYERNTEAVENALADLMSASVPVRAVIMVGAYRPCAKFVRLSREMDFSPVFLNVSFVGTEAFIEAAGTASEGVIITQVVPAINDDSPVTRAYQTALPMWSPGAKPGYGSLEGYVATRILLRAMAQVQGEVTREALVDALEGMGEFEIGLGTTLSLSKTDHQASNGVWPTIVRDGRAVWMPWSALGGSRVGGVPE